MVINEREIELESLLLPGSILKKEREKKGLRRLDVARDLKLSEKFVSYLEQDHYEKLPGPTYVKGYVRSYARYLNIAADELITQLDNLYSNEDMPRKRLINVSRQARPGDPLIKWASIAIMILFLALSTVWWRSHSDLSSTTIKDVGAVPAESAVNPLTEDLGRELKHT